MIAALGYAAEVAKAPLVPFTFERRATGPRDVRIEIAYCGVCHSALHQVRDEWGYSRFPMVPGHQIIGRVIEVGAQVKKFRTGELAGVGCIVDSCRSCASCRQELKRYCEQGFTGTYNALERDGQTPTKYRFVIDMASLAQPG